MLKLFSKLKIGTKLISGFVIVALIAGAVGLVGFWGQKDLSTNKMPGVETLLKIHLEMSMISGLDNLLMSPKLTYAQKQAVYKDIQSHTGNLSREWARFAKLPMSSEVRKLWKDAEPFINAWWTGHDKFIAKSIEMDNLGIEDPAKVQYEIALRQKDHYSWIWTLSDSIATHRPFIGQLDPELCALGTWLNTYETKNPQLRQLMIEIDSAHAQVHLSGARINQLILDKPSGWEASALALYHQEAVPNVKITLDYLARMERTVGAAFSVQEEMLKQALDVNQKNFESAIVLIEDMVQANQKAVAADVARSSGWMLLITLGAIGLSVVLGMLISRAIKNPIRMLLQASERIAEGDLNVHVDADAEDEIGQLAKAFDVMTDKVNSVLLDIHHASDQVRAGSQQLAESSQRLSHGAAEQASAVEEITASLEQLAAQTSGNATNAGQASSIASQALKDAHQGNARMKEMLVSMEQINEASGRISKIIKVMDDIAFQTNLLALNAAVEAAHAGHQGRGFAVVAQEVRNLAAKSAEAARETTDMIENSIRSVNAGSQMAEDTAKALARIEQEVSRAARLMGEIAQASGEQAAGIDQVNRAVMQVSQVTQTNAATSEESAAASEELSGQAETLQLAVGRFSLKTQDYSLPVHEKHFHVLNEHGRKGITESAKGRGITKVLQGLGGAMIKAAGLLKRRSKNQVPSSPPENQKNSA